MATEQRLIDANAYPCQTCEVSYCHQNCAKFIAWFEKTVDAVEVVRCRDCKHFDPEKALRPGGIWCGYWGTDPDPDDFCSYGERRADDGC